MSVIEYEISDRVALITLNRPEKLNAVNNETSRLLWDALQDVKVNDDVWAVILTGAGRAFSAGRDLVERSDKGDLPGATNAEIYGLMRTIYKPMIAAINGICLAAASGFALSTDIRIAARGARFGWPQAKRGVASVSGPTILARLVPENIAMEYMFTGEFMSSEEALRWGLVNRVVDDGEALNEARAFAEKVLQNAPLSVRAMKEAALRTTNLRVEEAYALGKDYIKSVDGTEDLKEGLLAFKEKREPVWKAR